MFFHGRVLRQLPSKGKSVTFPGMLSLLQGFFYNTRGFQFFWSNRSLWKYLLVPLVVNVLLFAGLLALAFHYADDLHAFLMQPLQGLLNNGWDGVWGTLLAPVIWVLEFLLMLILWVATLILVGVVMMLLSSIINAPFYEMISERILIMQGVWTERDFIWRKFVAEVLRSLKFETGKTAMFVGVTLVLTLLGWIPVVGPVFVVLQMLFMSWLFAWGISAFPLLLKGTGFRHMVRLGLGNKMVLIGFGSVSLLPLVGILIMPFQVAGGTLLCLDKMWEGS